MAMNRFDAIAFDLDGTLVDSAGAIAHALNAALAAEGLPGFDLDTVRAWIGEGPDALIARALGAHKGATAELPADTTDLAARLRIGFDLATLQAPMTGSSVFEGIARLLGELVLRRPLAVVTNKPTPLALAVLQAAGLAKFFESVHGADQLLQRKPSPLLLRQAASALGVAPNRLLMVGDAAIDIAAARAAGCPVAWAGWGYGHVPSLSPDEVWRLATPDQLLLQLAIPAGAQTQD